MHPRASTIFVVALYSTQKPEMKFCQAVWRPLWCLCIRTYQNIALRRTVLLEIPEFKDLFALPLRQHFQIPCHMPLVTSQSTEFCLLRAIHDVSHCLGNCMHSQELMTQSLLTFLCKYSLKRALLPTSLWTLLHRI